MPTCPTHLSVRPARSRPPRRARNSECLARSGGLRLASGGSAPGAAWAPALGQEGTGALRTRRHPLGLPGSSLLRACGVGDTPGTRPALCSSEQPGALVPARSFLRSAPPAAAWSVLPTCVSLGPAPTSQPHNGTPAPTCSGQRPSPFLLRLLPASALSLQELRLGADREGQFPTGRGSSPGRGGPVGHWLP